MKKINKRILAGAVGLLLAAGAMTQRSDAAPPGVAWKPSLQVALQEAKRTKKPVMVELGAKWCAPCRAMEKNTYTQLSVVRESRKWVPVKIDIEAHPEIAARYGLQNPPLVVFLKSDGTVVSKFTGYADAAGMVKQMQAAYAKTHAKASKANRGASKKLAKEVSK